MPSRELDKRVNYADLSPSPELSYLIGAILGDGSVDVNKRMHRIRFYNTDRQLIDKVIDCFQKVIGKQPYVHLSIRTFVNDEETYRYITRLYRVQIGSKNLYNVLNMGLDALVPIVMDYPEYFVAGFFDADGCVSYSKKGKYIHKQISITNTDKGLLSVIQDFLRRLGIMAKIYCYDIGRLKILQDESTEKFGQVIPSHHSKKKRRLLLNVSEW